MYALLFLVAFFGSYERSWKNGSILLLTCGTVHLCQCYPANFPKTEILYGAGGAAVLAQWFCAERLTLKEARTCRVARQHKGRSGLYRKPTAYGGMPLLIQATFIRTFLIGLPIFPMLLLVMAADKKVTWQDATYITHHGMALFLYWFIPVFPLTYSLAQLRYFRTLPISTMKLAALIILIALLPLIGLGALPVWAVGWVSGPPASLAMLERMAFVLAPASLCVSIAVWRGISRESYWIGALVMLVFPAVPFCLSLFFHDRHIPLIVAGLLVVICVALALQLTRRLLLQSSYTYRIQKNPYENGVWR